jgi:hypothetical protein
MFSLFRRNHLSVVGWLLNNASLSPNELDFVRNVRSKLERNRTSKPSPDQRKWLHALYEREPKLALVAWRRLRSSARRLL